MHAEFPFRPFLNMFVSSLVLQIPLIEGNILYQGVPRNITWLRRNPLISLDQARFLFGSLLSLLKGVLSLYFRKGGKYTPPNDPPELRGKIRKENVDIVIDDADEGGGNVGGSAGDTDLALSPPGLEPGCVLPH